MSAEENKALVQRIIDEWYDEGNMAVVDELFATDYVYHLPGSEAIRGIEGLKELGSMFHTAFSKMQHIIEDMVAEGDKVVARFTFRATHTGEFRGIAPTDKQVEFPGIAIWCIADGKIVEEWSAFDTLGFMQQLGAVPPLGEIDNEQQIIR